MRKKSKSLKPWDEDDDVSGTSEVSSGSISGRRGSSGQQGVFASYLSEETETMAAKRRVLEQEGHRRLASVHQVEHALNQTTSSPEGELQNDILQHPALDSQRFDGIDPNLNPEPPLNTEARREFDNERREQEKEKQLRLGNMPTFAPKPHGPN